MTEPRPLNRFPHLKRSLIGEAFRSAIIYHHQMDTLIIEAILDEKIKVDELNKLRFENVRDSFKDVMT